MKHFFIILTSILLGGSATVHAQKKFLPYNRLSLEMEYGLSVPTTIVSQVGDQRFVSPIHLGVGGRYMFNQKWGVKGNLVYDEFKESADLGTRFIRMDAQAHFNLGRDMGITYGSGERVGLYAHSGLGLTFAKSYYNDSTEHNINLLIGLSPLFRISNKFAILTDVTYNFNFRQHFSFDGIPFDPPTVEYKTGGQFTFSVGAVIYLGDEERHADWY